MESAAEDGCKARMRCSFEVIKTHLRCRLPSHGHPRLADIALQSGSHDRGLPRTTCKGPRSLPPTRPKDGDRPVVIVITRFKQRDSPIAGSSPQSVEHCLFHCLSLARIADLIDKDRDCAHDCGFDGLIALDEPKHDPESKKGAEPGLVPV